MRLKLQKSRQQQLQLESLTSSQVVGLGEDLVHLGGHLHVLVLLLQRELLLLFQHLGYVGSEEVWLEGVDYLRSLLAWNNKRGLHCRGTGDCRAFQRCSWADTTK